MVPSLSIQGVKSKTTNDLELWETDQNTAFKSDRSTKGARMLLRDSEVCLAFYFTEMYLIIDF